jgi:hypothetical protein
VGAPEHSHDLPRFDSGHGGPCVGGLLPMCCPVPSRGWRRGHAADDVCGSGWCMRSGGQTATARRWPQSRGSSRARRCSCWSPPITSSVREGWTSCLWPVSRRSSSIPHPVRRPGRRGPGCGWWTGAVVAFGKHLEEPAIDCGAFLLPLEVFGRQRQAAAEGDHSLAGAVTRLAQTRPLRVVELPAGCWWQDVDTPEDVQAARVALRRSLGKDADGPVSRLLNRPLSTRLSMVLTPRPGCGRQRGRRLLDGVPPQPEGPWAGRGAVSRIAELPHCRSSKFPTSPAPDGRLTTAWSLASPPPAWLRRASSRPGPGGCASGRTPRRC